MLLLCVFLLSSCLPGSMGRVTDEFQENFKAVVDLLSKDIFLPAPQRKFECNYVPCHLNRTIESLKRYSKTEQVRTYVSLMEQSMKKIISTFNTPSIPEKGSSCQTPEVRPQRALKLYERFFQNLHEMC